MIKNGKGGANTISGMNFENCVHVNCEGVNLTKHNLYNYLKKNNIDYTTIISKKLLPDEAYFNPNTKEFFIYEKKFQSVNGSVDEKPQTCGFKIHQFRKIGKAIGAEKVTYTYIFNNWFKKPEYKDMLDYIKSIDGCNYIFAE